MKPHCGHVSASFGAEKTHFGQEATRGEAEGEDVFTPWGAAPVVARPRRAHGIRTSAARVVRVHQIVQPAGRGMQFLAA